METQTRQEPFLRPQNKGDNEELIKWRLNPKHIEQELFHALKGEKLTKTGYEPIKIWQKFYAPVKDGSGKTVFEDKITVEDDVPRLKRVPKYTTIKKQVDIKPKICEEGIHSLLNMLRPNLSKIVTLSHYNDDRISKQMLRIMRVIRFWLAKNYKRYEISLNDFDEIKNGMIAPIIYANLLRANDAGERDGIDKSHTTIEHRDLSPNRPEFKYT